MAIKGSLRAAGLADVVQLLAIGQKTGCLAVTDRARFGQIYLDRGRITYATIINRRDRLGDLLIRDGKLSHDELASALDAQAEEPDRRLGDILLDQGVIDRDTLTATIEKQIEGAIYYLFTWKQGHFHFEPDKAPEHGEHLISVNPEGLLLEGARRIDEWSVIQRKIPSMDVIFAVDHERLAGADPDLTDAQRRLVAAIDGERTAEELASAVGLDEFETGKALYGLAQAGFVRRAGRRADEPDEEPDPAEARNLAFAFYQTAMLDDAERAFRSVLRTNPSDDTARHYLALIALRRGDLATAVQGLSALLESGGPRVGVFLNLAYALRRQRRFARALRVLDEAKALAPDDARVALAEGATRLFAGEAGRAATILEDYRSRLGPDATPPATYAYCAGLAALVDGRPDRAEAIVEEGLRDHPREAPLHLLAGTLAERLGDLEAAEQAYQRAAVEDPHLPQAHRNLGELLQRRGVDREALEHYERAAEIDPDLGDGLYTRLADLYYRDGRRDDAIRCWRRALELNPENDRARSRLEVVARASG